MCMGPINTLEKEDGSIIKSKSKILNEIERFYKNLYSKHGEFSAKDFDEIIKNSSAHLPKLNNSDMQCIEGEITIPEECGKNTKTR